MEKIFYNIQYNYIMSKTYRRTRRTYSVMQKLKHLNEQTSSGLDMATYADKVNIPARTLQKMEKK